MDSWYLANLVCPRDRDKLEGFNDELRCSAGHAYPIIDGIPVMLLDEKEPTIGVARKSLSFAKGDNRNGDSGPPFYLDTLAIGDEEKNGIRRKGRENTKIDPVVSYMVAATNGHMYRAVIGKLDTYPIPEIRLGPGNGKTFLDIGCNWGRWCIAAAKKGYAVVGLDPSLGAIMAARRVSESLGLSIKYLVADGRYLPFDANSYDQVFSYSVLQHFAKQDTRLVLAEIARVLRPEGKSLVQMPNCFGLRSLYHQARRSFRKPTGFDVRYWSLPELKRTFTGDIGDTTIQVDCFGGLGIQRSDWQLVGPGRKLVVAAAEILRAVSNSLPFLTYAADSVYLESQASGVSRQKPQ